LRFCAEEREGGDEEEEEVEGDADVVGWRVGA